MRQVGWFACSLLKEKTAKHAKSAKNLFFAGPQGWAYNLANFLHRLASPRDVKHWSLTTLLEKLVKIGAKVTRHSKYVTLQLTEVAVTRRLFSAILDRIERLALPPPASKGADA